MELRQVGIPIKDIHRAVTFYTSLLGYDPLAVFSDGKIAFFSLGKTRLFLDGNISQESHSGFIYVEVDDINDSITRWRQAGIRIITEPHIVFDDAQGIFDRAGKEWLAFIEDSEGNRIGVMSREATS